MFPVPFTAHHASLVVSSDSHTCCDFVVRRFGFWSELLLLLLNYLHFQHCSAWNITILPQIESFEPDSLQVVYFFVYLAIGVLVLDAIQLAAYSMAAAR